MKKSLTSLLAISFMLASAQPAIAGRGDFNGLSPGFQQGDVLAGRVRGGNRQLNHLRANQMRNNRLANMHNNELPNVNPDFFPLPVKLQMPMQHGRLRQQIEWNGRKLELDLSSNQTEIILGTKLFKAVPSVTITVGDTTKTFEAGSQVTAAEYVAIKNALAGKEQTLSLNSDGSASGGSFQMNGIVTPRVNQLVIPSGVTGVNDFAAGKTIGIRGDLLNFGSIYAISTDENSNSGRIMARNIDNGINAIIGTDLPDGLLSNLFSESAPEFNLNLTAMKDINNAGRIDSTGSLTLTAGGTVTNSGRALFPRIELPSFPENVTNVKLDDVVFDPIPLPVIWPPIRLGGTIVAHGDVNINAGSGKINNRGEIASINGDINMNTLKPDGHLNISSVWGTYNAPNGDINVRAESYAGSSNLIMFGGDFRANNINLYSGTGKITGAIGEVSGNLHTVGDTTDFHTGINWFKLQPFPVPPYPVPIDPPIVILNN